MAAEEGNSYGLKWDLKTIKEVITNIHEWLKEDTQGKKCFLISEAIDEGSKRDDLYPDVWNYWKSVLQKSIGCKPEDESTETKEERLKVFRTIKKIDGMMETRIAKNALNRKTSTPMAIFMLKNNHGWKDEQKHDHTSKGQQMTSFNGPVQVQVFNSNPNVEFDEEGNLIADTTAELAQGAAEED